MIAILRQRNFALLWCGGLISILGDWVLIVALPFYIYNQTGSTLATGVMLMAQTLPRILVGSVAGVFVDRWNRKRVMVCADLSRALLLLLLLLVRDSSSLWLIYVVAAVQASIAQFFDPAKNALLPNLVGQEYLSTANSLNILNNNLARLIGPVIGGVLLGGYGLASVVLLDSLSFLFSGVLISLIAQPTTIAQPLARSATTDPRTAWMRLWHDWLEGLRLVRRNPIVSSLFLVGSIASVAEGFFVVLFVAFVQKGLHGGALEFGWIMTSQAVGGVLSSAAIGRFGKTVMPSRLIGMIALNGILLLILFNLPSLPLALVIFVAAGIVVVGYSTGLFLLLQKSVDDRYRGRIFGAFGTTSALMLLLGQGLAGMLGDTIGVIPAINGKGILDILAGVVGLILLERASRRVHQVLADQSGA
jgi:MFS family permease